MFLIIVKKISCGKTLQSMENMHANGIILSNRQVINDNFIPILICQLFDKLQCQLLQKYFNVTSEVKMPHFYWSRTIAQKDCFF